MASRGTRAGTNNGEDDGGSDPGSSSGRYLSPGVYIEEVSSGSRPIEAVGTSIAAFVGFGENSPDDGLWLRRGGATILVVGAVAVGVWAWRRGAARRNDRRPSLIRLPLPLDNIQPFGCILFR